MTIATTTSCSNHKSCIANVHTHPHREFVSPAIIIYDDAAAGVDVFVSKRLQLMSIGLMVTQLVVSTFFFSSADFCDSGKVWKEFALFPNRMESCQTVSPMLNSITEKNTLLTLAFAHV